MKYHKIDNSLNNLGKTVLWQYDRAVRLLSVLKYMQVLYHCAVEQFWEFWTTKVLSINTCGTLGCSIWGLFLGIPRPTIIENGTERPIVASVYRRLLKGAFYLMKSSSSFEDILGYLEIVFGVGGDGNFSKWSDYVSEYGWSTNIEELNSKTQEVEKYYPRLAYKKGIVFYYQTLDSNWKCLRDIKVAENTSFEDLLESGAIQETIEPATKIGGDSTLLLKLYDPEGICRKIGGAPSNSLSISVSYEFGDTTIIARATRRKKCGITLVDNGDMSIEYGKSKYYEEMHRDQKYLFEQMFEEVCPFPLGIRTNEPIGNWVFGLPGQSNVLYAPHKEHAVGDIFGYIEEDGDGCNWECQEKISADENVSFAAIKDKLRKTAKGGPFIDTLAEDTPPYRTISNQIVPSVDLISIQNEVATIFPPNTLMECRENGMTKIFHNTTQGNLVVCHSAEDEWVGQNPSAISNFIGWEFVSDPTPENIMEAMGRLCRLHKCPALTYAEASRFIPGVVYNSGMVVNVDGKERIVATTKQMKSKEDIIANSIPQRKANLHEFYPYIMREG